MNNQKFAVVLCTLAASLLHTISFPNISIYIAGFIFLVPLFYVLERYQVKRAFLLFFSASFLSFLFILNWIPRVMVRYGGMPESISIFGIGVLAVYMSLYNGIAGIFIKKILTGPAGNRTKSRALLLIPLIWVVKDLAVEHVITGFPWCLAGYSQYPNTLFIQLAEFGGIHMITFLTVLINVLIYRLFCERRRQYATVLGILLVCIYSTGFYLYRTSIAETYALPLHKAGIIQPNTSNDYVPSKEKEKIIDRLLDESRQLGNKGAEFVIWPEHTVSIYPLQNRRHYQKLSQFSRDCVPLLAGFTDLQANDKIFNSAILFEKDGGFQKYDKVHLTPYGEYIMFREILFFVKRITDEIADFTPGDEVKNLELNGHHFSTPICYEIIFPGLVRRFVSNGGQLIITISNDSWFGDTSAPYQHLYMGAVRSIENRRFILRSTTNGISAVITPWGEIRRPAAYGTSHHFLGEFRYLDSRTIFNRFGYLFPFGCLLVLLIITGIKIAQRPRGKQ